MKIKVTRKKVICFFLFFLILFIVLGLINPLKTTYYQISSERIPKEFEGYRILQISDFHCKDFGKNEEQLIQQIKETNPNLILLTGDIVDEKHDINNFEALIEGIHGLAPIYYITGNHEYAKGAPYNQIYDLAAKYNFTILNNQSDIIFRDGASIKLTGLDYKSMTQKLKFEVGYADTNYYNLLLFHGSDEFDYLSNFNYDLVFTGHVHGGIIRLPLLGGLLGNHGNFFPKYDHGIFHKKNSTLVVNSGLGDASIPRFNNPREIVLVELHSEIK